MEVISTKQSSLQQLDLLARLAPKVEEEKVTPPKAKIMPDLESDDRFIESLSMAELESMLEESKPELEREAMAELQWRFGSNLGQKHNEPWYMRVLKVGIKTFMAWSVLLLPVILFIV